MKMASVDTKEWRYVAIGMTGQEIHHLSGGKPIKIEVADGVYLRVMCNDHILERSDLPSNAVLAMGANHVALLKRRFLERCLAGPKVVEVVSGKFRFQFFSVSQCRPVDVVENRIALIETD